MRVPRIATRRAIALCASISASIAVSSASALPVHSWTVQSDSAAASRADGLAAAFFPDGRSAVSGLFAGTNVDLGDGVARSSATNGGFIRGSAFSEFFGPDGANPAVRVAGVNSSTLSMAGRGIAVRGDGSVVTAGEFTGVNVEFGGGVLRTSANGGTNSSSYATAQAPDGSVLWAATTTSAGTSDARAYGADVRADGSVVIAGSFQGTNVDLGDGILRTSPNSGGSASMFVQALGATDGSVAWTLVSTAAGSSSTVARGVSVLPDGSAVVTGYFQGTNVDLGDGTPRTSANAGASSSSFTLKVSAGGAVEWVTTSTAPSSSSVLALGAAAMPDGAAVITGYFQGTNVDLGGGIVRTSTSNGSDSTFFALALAPDGTAQWARTPTAPTGAQTIGTAVAARTDGRSVVTGYFSGSAVDFGDGVPRTSGDSGNDRSVMALEMEPDGSVSWVSTSTGGALTSAYGYGVSALDDGSTLLTGYFTGVNVDLGDGVPRTSSGGGSLVGRSLFAMGILSTPGAPAPPVATAGVESATVSVTPLPGASITSYTIRATSGAGTCTIVPPASACTVTGLAAGVPRSFTAEATNAAGRSSPSGASAPVTPTAAPSTTPAGITPTAALTARLLPQRTRLTSGQQMRIGIRTRNTGTATASRVTSCIRLPSNMAIVRKGSALRSGRTLCFRVGEIPAASQRTRVITVRAASARTVRRTITASARAEGQARVGAPARSVTIRPRAVRARVTG